MEGTHRPPSPGEGYVWVDGFYVWDPSQDHQEWVWIMGHWTMPPYPGQKWLANYWAPNSKSDGYTLHLGRWE